MLHVRLHHIVRHQSLHATSLRTSHAGTESLSGDVYMQALNRYQETFIDASFYFYGSPHSMYRRKSGDSSWAHCSAPDASPGVRTDLQDLPEYHVLRAG